MRTAKKDKLTAQQRKLLTSKSGLGCRNPVGLDQLLVSETLSPAVLGVLKVPIGVFGGSISARPPQHPEPLPAVSDHCPVVLELNL